MVEIGGEVRTIGNKQGNGWKIAIESPSSDPTKRSIQKVIDLENQSLATSGSYRNFFESDGKRYSHTFDPVAGKPVEQDLVSVTVLADNCAKADALATALICHGARLKLDNLQRDRAKGLFSL